MTFSLSSFLDEEDLLVFTRPRASLGSLAAGLGEAGTDFFGSFFAALIRAGSIASYAGGGIKVGDKPAATLGEGDLETTLSWIKAGTLGLELGRMRASYWALAKFHLSNSW